MDASTSSNIHGVGTKNSVQDAQNSHSSDPKLPQSAAEESLHETPDKERTEYDINPNPSKLRKSHNACYPDRYIPNTPEDSQNPDPRTVNGQHQMKRLKRMERAERKALAKAARNERQVNSPGICGILRNCIGR